MSGGASHEWRSHGRVLEPPTQLSWLSSHAALPSPQPRGDKRYRVYFSGRDSRSRSQLGAFTLDLEGEPSVTELTELPLLQPGRLGAFDDSGTAMSSIVEQGGRTFLYYTGWALGVTVPFYFAIGLAISEDGGRSFSRFSEAPVLDRSRVDPFLAASPSVLVENGLWRMWYVSGDRWEMTGDGPRHYYHIRYAESSDGLEWKPTGKVCVDFETEDEYAFSRPSVRMTESGYEMWYAVRGSSYRIGYATSRDGLDWQRRDSECRIEPSGAWDAEMQAYPAVTACGDGLVMLYNGNGYGATGIGMALAESRR